MSEALESCCYVATVDGKYLATFICEEYSSHDDFLHKAPLNLMEVINQGFWRDGSAILRGDSKIDIKPATEAAMDLFLAAHEGSKKISGKPLVHDERVSFSAEVYTVPDIINRVENFPQRGSMS